MEEHITPLSTEQSTGLLHVILTDQSLCRNPAQQIALTTRQADQSFVTKLPHCAIGHGNYA